MSKYFVTPLSDHIRNSQDATQPCALDRPFEEIEPGVFFNDGSKAFLPMMENGDPNVRVLAVAGMRRFADQHEGGLGIVVVERLAKALNDEVYEVRLEALKTLGAFNEEVSEHFFFERKKESPDTERFLKEVASNFESALPFIANVLAHEPHHDWPSVTAATRVVSYFPQFADLTVPLLLRSVREGRHTSNVFDSIGWLTEKEEKEVLEEMMASDDLALQFSASKSALGFSSGPDAPRNTIIGLIGPREKLPAEDLMAPSAILSRVSTLPSSSEELLQLAAFYEGVPIEALHESETLEDSLERVRSHALFLLGASLGAQENTESTKDAFKIALDRTEVISDLLESLGASEPTRRKLAAYILGRSGTKNVDVISSLREMTHSLGDEVIIACEALYQLGMTESNDAHELLRLLYSSSEISEVQTDEAPVVFGKIAKSVPDYLYELAEALKADSANRVLAAKYAAEVGPIGKEDLGPVLFEILTNEQSDVQLESLVALGNIGFEKEKVVKLCISYLGASLKTEDPEGWEESSWSYAYTRKSAAIKALGSLGKDAALALPALHKIRASFELTLSKRAEEAISRIELDLSREK